MRHEATDVRMMGARHETIDEPRVLRLIPPRVSGLTSRAPTSWPKVKLGDAPITIIDGDRGKNYPKQNELFASGYCLFLSAENVTRQGFRFDSNKFITIQKDSVLRNGKLARFDIILTTRGTLGNVALYGSSVPFENVRINSGMLILRCDTQKLLPNFLLYVLRSEDFISQVNGFKSGVAQPQLPIKDLKQIQIPLPPLSVQRHIADVLSAYDDLIENNRRRIAILEETARLAYRKWFGGANTARTATLGEIAPFVRGKVITQKSAVLGNVPVVAGGLEPAYFHNVANTGTPVITISGSGANAGFARMYFEPIWASDCLWCDKAKAKWFYFAYCFLKDNADALRNLQQGAAQPHVYPKDINALDVVLPKSDDLLDKFESAVEPFFNQCGMLAKQSAALAAARNVLLPRLMKGAVNL